MAAFCQVHAISMSELLRVTVSVGALCWRGDLGTIHAFSIPLWCTQLQLLSSRNLVGAVREYVDKGERQAMFEVVDRSMKAAQESLKEKPVEEMSEDIAAEIDKRWEELRKRQEEEGERAIQVGGAGEGEGRGPNSWAGQERGGERAKQLGGAGEGRGEGQTAGRGRRGGVERVIQVGGAE